MIFAKKSDFKKVKEILLEACAFVWHLECMENGPPL